MDSVEVVDHCDIWIGICPPKVEVFDWQLMRGRIIVKKVLMQFGFNVAFGLDYSLCNYGVETIDHLFLSYSWTWGLWIGCMSY